MSLNELLQRWIGKPSRAPKSHKTKSPVPLSG